MGWPIFVISLADADDRRARIEDCLRALDLPFSFLDAVDGRNGLPPHLEPLIDRSRARETVWRPMTDGEFACALSHQTVYEQIIDRELPGAVVLEDDAIPTPGFRQFYEGEVYLRADLIQLDHMKARVWPMTALRVPDVGTFYRPAMQAVLATGYSISNRAAADIRSRSFPISRKADWPCDVLRLDIRLSDPRLIDHPAPDGTDSFLDADRVAMEMAEAERRTKPLRKYSGPEKLRRWVIKRLSRQIS